MPVTARLLRAVAAEFLAGLLRRLGWPVCIVIAGSLVLLLCLGQLVSAWWYILLVPVGVAAGLAAGLFGVAYLLIRRLRPVLDTRQRRLVRDFCTKLLRAAETVRTPYPLLLLITVKDVILHQEARLVQALLTDSAGLRRDYQALRQSFIADETT